MTTAQTTAQTTEKATATNIAVALGKGKFEIFNQGVEAYASGYNQPAKDIRSLHYKIGKSLNLIYIDLKESGVKRDEISVIAEKYFPSMTTDTRSKYRKFASNYKDITKHVIRKNPDLYSLQRIIKKYNDYTGKLKKAEKEAEQTQEVFVKDDQGNVIPLESKVIQEQKVKTGFDIESHKGKLTAQELALNYKRITKEIMNRYKSSYFTDTKENTESYNQVVDLNNEMHTLFNDMVFADKLAKLDNQYFENTNKQATG